jgi:hypothetical protein
VDGSSRTIHCGRLSLGGDPLLGLASPVAPSAADLVGRHRARGGTARAEAIRSRVGGGSATV